MISEALQILISADTANATRNLKDFQETAFNIGKTMSMTVTPAIIGAGVAGVVMAADLEKTAASFETLLGSAELSKQLFDEIKDLSAFTPFQLQDLTSAATRVIAFGAAQEDVIKILRNLGNAAQGNTEIFNRLVDAFGKTQVKGKASLEELNRFAEAGVPIFDALSESIGVTTEQLFDMVSKGQVTFEEVNSAIENLTTGSGKFAGMLEKQSETLSGKLSTLKDNVGLLAAELGQELLPMLKDGSDWIIEMVRNFTAMDDSQKKTVITLGVILAAIGPVTAAITGMSGAVIALKTALAGPAGLIALGAAIGGSMIIAAVKTRTASDAIKDLSADLTTLQHVTNNIDFSPLEKFANQFTMAGDMITTALDVPRLQIMLENVKNGVLSQADMIAVLRDEYGLLGDEAMRFIRVFGDVEYTTFNTGSAILYTTKMVQRAASETGNLTDDTELLTNEMNNYVDSLQSTINTLNTEINTLNNAGEATNKIDAETQALINSLNSENEALKNIIANLNNADNAMDQMGAGIDDLDAKLSELGQQFLEDFATLAKSGFIDYFYALGSGIDDGTAALKKFASQMLMMTSQLLLNAGLQLIVASGGNPAFIIAGLALVAASGLVALGAGAVNKSANNAGASTTQLNNNTNVQQTVITNNYVIRPNGSIVSSGDLSTMVGGQLAYVNRGW